MKREELMQVAKPILFNTEMVQAILDGRKMVTRRVVKPKSKNACGFFVTFRKSDGAFMGVYDYDENEKMFESSQKPPYAAGDYLYVRETWNWYNDTENGKTYIYRADYGEEHKKGYWKPSLHMPKEAARLFLKVTDVRVERLQDITPKEIEREGLKNPCVECYAKRDVCEDCICRDEYVDKLIWSELWNSTIKKQDLDTYGWEANPWVWVIEFERIEV